MDLAILCDVELKLAPVDVIWLFSVFMESLPAICDSGVPTTPKSIPIEVLVVMAASIKLSKMAVYSTMYSS